ncbi:unnamed protein product, partial [Brenthis ino]
MIKAGGSVRAPPAPRRAIDPPGATRSYVTTTRCIYACVQSHVNECIIQFNATALSRRPPPPSSPFLSSPPTSISCTEIQLTLNILHFGRYLHMRIYECYLLVECNSPDICISMRLERDAYGNEVNVSAKRLPVAYLLVDVPCGVAPASQPPTFDPRATFPPAHRPLQAHVQSLRALHRHLQQYDSFLEAASDFHVLLYMASNEALPLSLEQLAPLLDAVRERDAAAADAWRAEPHAATLLRLARAAHDAEPDGGAGGADGAQAGRAARSACGRARSAPSTTPRRSTPARCAPCPGMRCKYIQTLAKLTFVPTRPDVGARLSKGNLFSLCTVPDGRSPPPPPCQPPAAAGPLLFL